MPNRLSIASWLLIPSLLLVAGCASTPSKAANDVYKQGLTELKTGNNKTAIDTF